MIYRVVRYTAFCILRIFFGLTVRGRDCIPRQGAFILASNHISNLDPMVLGSVCYNLYILAKEELFRPSLWGAFLRQLKAVPLRRGRADLTAMKTALALLKNSRPVLIFPQGGRGGKKARPGVGFLYKKTDVPLILAKVTGTDTILPKGRKWPSPGKITVTFTRAAKIDRAGSPQEIADRIFGQIKNSLLLTKKIN